MAKALIDSITDLLNREPFVPFRIVLTSGKEYEVSNPNLVAVGLSEITVYAPKSDRWAMLRLTEVASLEAAQAA